MTVLFQKKTMAALAVADELDSIARPWGITLVDQILNVRKRLESPELQVAVVGRFKSGKSMLINALLGDDILPYDVLPCTACEVYIRYEDQPTFQIQDGGDSLRTVTREQLKEHVTAAGSDLAKRAEIGIPHPLLKQGLRIVDTPGFEDVNQTRSEVVFGVLPESDAIIMMFDAAAIGNTEIQFLKERVFSSTLSRCIFVINKVDLLSETEVIEVQEYLREILETWIPAPRIVTLSAKRHLDAALGRGAQVERSSGNGSNEESDNTLGIAGVPGLIEILQKEILGERDAIVAQVIDAQVQGMLAWVETEFGGLKQAMMHDSAGLEEEVVRLESDWKELVATFDTEQALSNKKLDAIIKGFCQKLEDFIRKYQPALSQRIMSMPIEKLQDSRLLAAAIETSIKEWLDKQIPVLESELLGLFEDHDRAIASAISPSNAAFRSTLATEGNAAPLDGGVIPGLLMGGWFLLGWTNFIALAAATYFAGDSIKKAFSSIVGNERQMKEAIAEKASRRLKEIGENLSADISRQLRAEFDRRMAGRREEALDRVNERRKLYVQAQEGARTTGPERELKLQSLEQAIQNLAAIKPNLH